MKQKENAVKGLTQGVAYLFKSNKVTHFQGFGSITSPNEVTVTKKDNTTQLVKTKKYSNRHWLRSNTVSRN